ncbi:glycoside hydrolase family 15 protein [Kocuria sp.]|uniref:glycoside hydrolase family 15 protein n=1 Tax=Kocuria sp. TaxID=1871328 RepID=UPI0026DEC10F|nr:glycoside hydrolase family 15 protein [Kocuria sp.]MDO5619171.1 glycoside hydrolase family 15 protein [Kocuria sp.]
MSQPKTTQPHTARSIPLEDYALLSDLHTGPLVSRHGSIDWLCFPDFDSPAVFSAILGDADDGRWRLSIADGHVVQRRYREGSFVLETYWESPTGKAVVVDVLPAGDQEANLIRQVTCTEGSVQVEHDLRIRPDFGRSGAWTRKAELPEGGQGLVSVAGPEMLVLRGPLLDVHEEDNGGPHSHPVPLGGQRSARMGCRMQLCADPQVQRDHDDVAHPTATWCLAWTKSWNPIPEAVDAEAAIRDTMQFWTEWSARVDVQGERAAMVERSLLVLRALTHQNTGGIVAAPTASLPEDFGGSRNWDYRYTWLRDASLTIEALVEHGFTDGAKLWRDWLLRAVAGDPWRVQIMYGIDGRRELPETELEHLAGYENSQPVRIGNGAVDQYQADVVGEVMLALAALRDAGRAEDQWSWNLQKHLLAFCAEHFDRKDHGIWEMRGDAAYFTHGRVMMWAAFNEGLRAVKNAPADSCVAASERELEQWHSLREALRKEIMEQGWNAELNSFVQTYGPGPGYREVDASLLQLPHTGFISADDPKMIGTTERIEHDLLDEHGFLHRYRTASGMDGLDGDEYPFLICLTWLGEQYANTGRLDEANQILDRLDECSSDLGLLAEEYAPAYGRLAGNFPQAFSHLGYVRLADAVRHRS